MKQYTNGKRIISATDKAFNIVYKKQGYVLVEKDMVFRAEPEPYEEDIDEFAEDENYSDYKVEELREIAKEQGITGFSSMKKADLIKALEGATNE